MPDTQTVDPAEVAAHIDAYRAKLVADYPGGPAAFVAVTLADPESIAAEVVDYASDWRDADISYDWETPDPLRDAIYNAGCEWAENLTADNVLTTVTAASLPILATLDEDDAPEGGWKYDGRA